MVGSSRQTNVTSINAATSPAWMEIEVVSTPPTINMSAYVNKSSAIVNAGVEVVLGNLRARLPSTGNRSLQIATVSGTYSVYGSCSFVNNNNVGASRIDSASSLNVTTTFAYLSPGSNFAFSGDICTWLIMDTSSNISWRISFIIGAGYSNNMITIEQLV